MSAILLTPRHDLTEAVLAQLKARGKDYSRNLVVFQGKRPAHVLRKRLAEELGSAFIPPRILSADSFIDYLYREKLERREYEVTALDASGILLSLQERLSHLLAGDRNRKLESFLPFGMKVFQELEELKSGGVNTTQLHGLIDQFLDRYNMPELLYLRDFYPAFYDALRERGFCSRASRYADAADSVARIDFSEWDIIILAGYASPNACETRILRHLSSLEHCRMIVQDTSRDSVAAEGVRWLKPDRAEAAPAPEAELSLYESSDAHGQLFGLAALLRGWEESGVPAGGETVIVVLKPETLFPLVSYGVSGIPEQQRNISLGYPLQRTPVYEFLLALVRAVSSKREGRYFAPAYLACILHPYFKNIRFENRTDVTRILMHTIEEEFFTGSAASFFSLEDILNHPGVFRRTVERLAQLDTGAGEDALRHHLREIHRNTFGVLEQVTGIASFGKALDGILRYIHAGSTAAMHPLFHPFVEAALNELETLRFSMVAELSFSNMQAYERLLARLFSAATQPFSGTPLHGLQILGILETRNLRFDRVIVLDANEDVLPGGKGGDMLLPQRIREACGIPTYSQRERLMGHHFHMLCEGANEVHLFYRAGNGMERSRFVEQMIWERQKTSGQEDTVATARTLQYLLSLANPIPGAVAKLPGAISAIERMQLSASSLDAYLHCPLKFYYRYILRLREQAAISGEIEHMEIGTAVHEILRAYFQPLVGKTLETQDIQPERMDAEVRRWFTEKYGSPLSGEALLIRIRVERRMREFLEQYQIPALKTSAIVIQSLEEEVECTEGGVTFRGVFDRVETRDGMVYILDYKTGGSLPAVRLNALDLDNRATWSEAVGSVQLPLYVRLYNKSAGNSPDTAVPRYLHLGKNKLDIKSESGIGREGTPASDWYPILSRLIDRLTAELRDPAVPFNPPHDPSRVCPACEYTTFCGTRWLT